MKTGAGNYDSPPNLNTYELLHIQQLNKKLSKDKDVK